MIEGALTINDQAIKVATFYNNRAWNTSSLSFNVPDSIMNLIIPTFIPSNAIKEDKMIWGIASNDIFSIKSAYLYLSTQTTSPTTRQNNYFNLIWKLKVLHNKLKTFLWLLQHDKLPTGAFLQKIGINCNPCFYLTICETTIHLFFNCPNAKLF